MLSLFLDLTATLTPVLVNISEVSLDCMPVVTTMQVREECPLPCCEFSPGSVHAVSALQHWAASPVSSCFLQLMLLLEQDFVFEVKEC